MAPLWVIGGLVSNFGPGKRRLLAWICGLCGQPVLTVYGVLLYRLSAVDLSFLPRAYRKLCFRNVDHRRCYRVEDVRVRIAELVTWLETNKDQLKSAPWYEMAGTHSPILSVRG